MFCCIFISTSIRVPSKVCGKFLHRTFSQMLKSSKLYDSGRIVSLQFGTSFHCMSCVRYQLQKHTETSMQFKTTEKQPITENCKACGKRTAETETQKPNNKKRDKFCDALECCKMFLKFL